MAFNPSILRRFTGRNRGRATSDYLTAVIQKKSIPEVRAEKKLTPVRQARARYGMENIVHVYSPKSRVMASRAGFQAVKLKTIDGEVRGWVSETSGFISETDLRNMLYSVDCTSSARIKGISLLELYDSLSNEQKARFAEITKDIDWDEFWKEMYPQKGVYLPDVQMDRYLEFIELFGDLKQWSQ